MKDRHHPDEMAVLAGNPGDEDPRRNLTVRGGIGDGGGDGRNGGGR